MEKDIRLSFDEFIIEKVFLKKIVEFKLFNKLIYSEIP